MHTAAAPRRTPSGELWRVLVVEDDPDMRELLVVRLRQWGYRTWEADDSAVALQLHHRFRPHLLIVGSTLPGLDGRQLIRAARRTHPDPSASSAILVTGGEDSPLDSRLGAVAARCLRRPFETGALRSCVDAAIAQLQVVLAVRELNRQLLSHAPQATRGVVIAGAHRCAPASEHPGNWQFVGHGPAGTVVLVAGQVLGDGPDVPLIAAHLRHVSRNHAAHCTDPRTMLSQLDAALRVEGADPVSGQPTSASAACVVVDRRGGSVRWATAGHPCPVLVPSGRFGPPVAVGTGRRTGAALGGARRHFQVADVATTGLVGILLIDHGQEPAHDVSNAHSSASLPAAVVDAVTPLAFSGRSAAGSGPSAGPGPSITGREELGTLLGRALDDVLAQHSSRDVADAVLDVTGGVSVLACLLTDLDGVDGPPEVVTAAGSGR